MYDRAVVQGGRSQEAAAGGRQEQEMERLECHVKEYAWGKYGDNSEVARLYEAGHKRFNIIQNVPYAEVGIYRVSS